MKDLYLLTTGYPYPAKSMETYLETEVKYYSNFRTVKILAMGVRKNTLDQKREVPGENIEVYPILSVRNCIISSMVLGLYWIQIFIKKCIT